MREPEHYNDDGTPKYTPWGAKPLAVSMGLFQAPRWGVHRTSLDGRRSEWLMSKPGLSRSRRVTYGTEAAAQERASALNEGRYWRPDR